MLYLIEILANFKETCFAYHYKQYNIYNVNIGMLSILLTKITPPTMHLKFRMFYSALSVEASSRIFLLRFLLLLFLSPSLLRGTGVLLSGPWMVAPSLTHVSSRVGCCRLFARRSYVVFAVEAPFSSRPVRRPPEGTVSRPPRSFRYTENEN